MLSKQELERYARHIIMPEVGKTGQEKLKAAKILVVGAGGLGSPVLLYLAAAGIGKLGIVDDDVIEENNLQRQIVHKTKDVGSSKAQSAKQAITDLNPHVRVVVYEERITSQNAKDIVKNYDIVVDCTDNFPTRYLMNDICVFENKPLVYGSIQRMEGHVTVFNHHNGPCYRCLAPHPPPPELVPSCAEAGVLGILPGIIGSIQATEAIKLALSTGKTLSGRYLVYNALDLSFKELTLKKNPDCVVCGENPTAKELIDYDQFCKGKQAKQQTVKEMTVQELQQQIKHNKKLVLIDVREQPEWDLVHLEEAKLVPLSTIMQTDKNELYLQDKHAEIALICRTGNRSHHVAEELLKRGFTNIYNVVGGIYAWATEIDTSMPTY